MVIMAMMKVTMIMMIIMAMVIGHDPYNEDKYNDENNESYGHVTTMTTMTMTMTRMTWLMIELSFKMLMNKQNKQKNILLLMYCFLFNDHLFCSSKIFGFYCEDY